MSATEKAFLKFCKAILNSSSVTDKIVLDQSVKFCDKAKKTVEVTLSTKEDEYMFIFDLSGKEIHASTDSHHCVKCASENKYHLKSVKIKGYDALGYGKIDIEYLWVILEKLAEEHARCIAKKNSEEMNKNYNGIFYESKTKRESFMDVLQRKLDEINDESIDRIILVDGIKTIEDSFQILLNSGNYESAYVNNFQKIFVKSIGKSLQKHIILTLNTEQNLPIVYDLLLTILSFTNQNMRQHYFHQLLDHYYKFLKENLQKLSLDVTKCLQLSAFDNEIHKLLPYVKLEILKQYCQASEITCKGNLNQYRIIREAIFEVIECILYPNLSREDCYEILKNKLKSTDYVLLNYKLTPLQEREGYLGDYFKLKIEVEHNDETKLLHLFAKYLPTYNDMAMDLATDTFKKEEFYYLQFIPELIELGLEDITNFLPKCYFSRTRDVTIFEDMTVMGYKTVHISVDYNYEMLLITVKQLAKIHASSLLYEELLSRKTDETVRIDEKYPEYVEEKTLIATKETLIKKTYDCAVRTFLNMLIKFPDIPKKFTMEEFQKRGKLAFDLCFEKIKKSDKHRNFLCHGDCWTSNIFFKTDTNNLPFDCCLVDYQLIRYCPSAHDIFFLFYMTTTKETRTKFESKLLQEYYSELSSIFERHKIDLEEVYTFQQFLDSCEYMRSQGLCHAIMILQFVLFPEEKLKDIFKDRDQVRRLFYVNRDIFVEELQYEGAYWKRMKELAEELYEVCENIKL